MAKIIFIQPSYAHYRRKLFDLLHEYHEVRFVFLQEKSSYPSNEGPNSHWNMTTLKREKNHLWFLHLVREIINFKPEAIVVSNNRSYQAIVAGVTGYILRIPVVLWSIAWESPSIEAKRPFWKKIIRKQRAKFTSRMAKAIVAGGSKAETYNRHLVSDKKPVFMAFQTTRDLALDGRNIDNFTTPNAPNSNNHVNILYFSKIIKYKGLDFLIRAFAKIESKHPNVKLRIAGDGPFRDCCENLASELQIRRIEFCGSVPNEQAWPFFSQANIFVLPHSGQQIEGWGLVLNEAASMCLPIVTTELAGAAGDIVKDGVNGYVVKPGDVLALQTAIEKLINNESKRKRMGKESRILFESINDYNKMYQGFDNAIRTALKKT
jgi:glycosyltransferase involved in cell wall biosynthesis